MVTICRSNIVMGVALGTEVTPCLTSHYSSDCLTKVCQFVVQNPVVGCQRKNIFPLDLANSRDAPLRLAPCITIVVLLISSPMILLDVDIANGGGTD